MKANLLAVNAKYVHSSLSVRFLAAGMEAYARWHHNVSVAEATINQNIKQIVDLAAENEPEAVGISTYIWNAGLLPDILTELRRRLPRVTVVLGGPEAAHNAEYWLSRGADFVLRGEGEHSLPMLLDALDEKDFGQLDDIPGLCFYKNKKPRFNPPEGLPGAYVNPYNDAYFQSLGGRIAYIETSRGCPFQCAYCLSGGTGVRFLPLERAKEQIKRLAESGTRTVKFVDRTFNCNAARAYAILEYVIGLPGDWCFHFEAAADLFDERTLALLNTAPPGRIQIEIGLQSFHKPTLEAVARKTNLEKAEKNIRTLLAGQNIHLHVDLIAGLPFETFPVFQSSFDRAYALEAHTLQMGFLKLLHGSRLREQAEVLGLVYQAEPPYEIISSPWLSEEEMLVLKRTENALQNTYNKGRFLSSLRYSMSASGLGPFALFRGLGEAAESHATPLADYAGQVYRYLSTLPGVNENKLRDHMVCDFLSMTKGKTMPDFLKSRGEKQRRAVETASRQLGRVIDYDEAAVLSSGGGVYADSTDRNPVTGLYTLHFFE